MQQVSFSRGSGATSLTLYSWMTPFCMWLSGGSHETLMLELLLGCTTVTVTALGGALGTERTHAQKKQESRKLKTSREERIAKFCCWFLT